MKNSRLTPKFFFISLGILVSLITIVSSFLVLFFEVLNKKFPDALNPVYLNRYNLYDFESIRASLAILIIFFPIFIFISYLWLKESKEDIGRQNLAVRKWMIYLVIFLASLTIVIDLVTLVRYFISGEITIRFILKISGTLIVAFIVDFYYSLKMKNKNFNSDKSKKWGTILAIVSTTLFVCLITLSFMIMGSPAKQRDLRLDETRISDLQSLQSQIVNYWQQKEVLPVVLNDLSNPISNDYLPIDPEFNKGKSYEYKSIGKLSFELCATFTENTPRDMKAWPVIASLDVTQTTIPSGLNDSWDHGKGRVCFNRTIDIDIYPPFKKDIKK